MADDICDMRLRAEFRDHVSLSYSSHREVSLACTESTCRPFAFFSDQITITVSPSLSLLHPIPFLQKGENPGI